MKRAFKAIPIGLGMAAWGLAALPMLANAQTSSASYHGPRPERNAFLNASVATTMELVREVQRDAEVSDRYMRHFGQTKPQVLHEFKGLHVEALPKDEPFTMYSVPDDGVIHSHSCVLRKGEKVFVDRRGKIWLRLKCGNPLVEGVQPVALGAMDGPEGGPSLSLRPMNDIPVTDTGIPSGADAVALAPTTEPELYAASPPEAPLVAPSPVTALGSATELPSVAGPTGGGGLGNLGSILAAAPIIGLITTLHPGAGNHGGGNQGGGGSNIVLPPPVSSVPEPATLALTAAGAVALLRKRRGQ